MVFLHSAWGGEPSAGVHVVEVGVASSKVELTATVFVEPEVEVLDNIYPVVELTVTVDVDPESGFEILGIEYFFMNMFRTLSPSGVMCCTSLE